MKGKNCDFSVSNIILRTDNKKVNQKRLEVNTHLKYMCNDKFIYLIGNLNIYLIGNWIIYLIGNTNQIKAQLLNKGSNVNKRGSNVDLWF